MSSSGSAQRPLAVNKVKDLPFPFKAGKIGTGS